MSHAKVVHPSAQYRIDDLDHAGNRLRSISSKDLFQLPHQFRSFRRDRLIARPPLAALASTSLKAEAKKVEVLSRSQIHVAGLLLVDLDLELDQFFP